jgi:hypothetical protein
MRPRSCGLAAILLAMIPTLVASRCAHGEDAVDDPVAATDVLDTASPPGEDDSYVPGAAGDGAAASVPIPELDPELEATFEPSPLPEPPPLLPGMDAGVDPSTDFGVPAGVPPIDDPGLPDPGFSPDTDGGVDP